MKYVKLNLTEDQWRYFKERCKRIKSRPVEVLEELVKWLNYEGNGSNVRSQANLWLEAEAIFYEDRAEDRANKEA